MKKNRNVLKELSKIENFEVNEMRIVKRKNKEQILRALHNMRYCDLSENFQKFVKYIFPNIKSNDLIICKKHSGSKIAFSIIVDGQSKNISVQSGDIVLVYKGRIKEFVTFLKSINVSKECIYSLLLYHYADGTYDGSAQESSSFGELLCVDYQKEIKIVEKEFRNKELLTKVIDFVLLREKSGLEIDYFYFGNACKGIFSSAEAVKKNIINEKNKYVHRFMRIGVMNFLPLNRNIIYTERGEWQRHFCVLKLNLKKYIKK